MPIAKGDERHMQHRYCIHCTALLPQEVEACSQCGGRQESQVPYHHLLPGTVLNGRYWVGAALGEGGFGITYIGRDLTLDRRIAIKEYFPSGFATRHNKENSQVEEITRSSENIYRQGLERFLKEAQLLAQFSKNASIVSVFDYFEANGTAYFIMEYLSGDSLKQYLDKRGSVSYKYMMAWFYPIFQALAAIHQVGVVHRDISPDNLILASDGNLKLIDFGAARDVLGSKSLSVVLKPGYAPIEQYSTTGKQGPWTDIYALCGTIYKCITGVTPPEATDRIVQDTLRKPSDLGVLLPKQFENTLMKGLSIRAGDRYQSMEELLEDLGQPMDKPVTEDSERTTDKLLPDEPGDTIGKPSPHKDSGGLSLFLSMHKRAVLAASSAAVLLVLVLSYILIFEPSSFGRETLSLLEESLVAGTSPSVESDETLDPAYVASRVFNSIKNEYSLEEGGILELIAAEDWETLQALEQAGYVVSFTIYTPSVVSFEEGTLTALSSGHTSATMRIGAQSKSCRIYVADAQGKDDTSEIQEKISAIFASIENAYILSVGETLPIISDEDWADLERENCSIVCESGSTIVASFEDGTLTANSHGKTTITIKIDDRSKTLGLQVVDALSEASLNRPAYLDTYIAPTSLGDDSSVPIFLLDDVIYQLPCPVSEWLNNGWDVTVSETSFLAPNETASASFDKAGLHISGSVTNFASSEEPVARCAVVYLYFEQVNIDEFPLLLPNALTLSSPYKEVEKVCLGYENTPFVKAVTRSGLVYLTENLGEEDMESNIEFCYESEVEDAKLLSLTIQNSTWDY